MILLTVDLSLDVLMQQFVVDWVFDENRVILLGHQTCFLARGTTFWLITRFVLGDPKVH